MPSVYDLKPAFQNLLRPVCRALVGAGVSANQVFAGIGATLRMLNMKLHQKRSFAEHAEQQAV